MITKDSLEALVRKGLTRTQMAEELGCGRTTVNKYMKIHNITNSGIHLCVTCGETDPSMFYGNRKNACKICQNKEKHNNQIANKEYGIKYLGGKCSSCGYDKCADALDFHHLDPSLKDVNAKYIRSWSKERIRDELDKCVLLCANCHREVHSAGYEN